MSRRLVVLDRTNSIFRFAYLSVREFLETQPDCSIQASHSLASQLCFVHLISLTSFTRIYGKDTGNDLFKSVSTRSDDAFLDYAVLY